MIYPYKERIVATFALTPAPGTLTSVKVTIRGGLNDEIAVRQYIRTPPYGLADAALMPTVEIVEEYEDWADPNG